MSGLLLTCYLLLLVPCSQSCALWCVVVAPATLIPAASRLPFSSPSGTETSDAQDGAGPESVQKDKPKPELVKRSEQDMCMVNILAKVRDPPLALQ